MRKWLGFALLVTLCGGCANDSAVGPSALDAALLATTWTVVSAQPTGRPELAAPTPGAFTLILESGRAGARVDCNSCGGSYTLSGTTLTVSSSMVCTRAACPGMEFGNQYLTLLGGDSAVDVSDRSLTLSSTRGILRLRR